MAIKEQLRTNFIDRAFEAHERWLERNMPGWLYKTVMLEEGGLLTPTASTRSIYFTRFLIGLFSGLLGILLTLRFLQ